MFSKDNAARDVTEHGHGPSAPAPYNRAHEAPSVLVTIVMAVYAASPLPLLAHGGRQDKTIDVAGKWALTVETSDGTGTPTIEFKQVGETLTGTYSSQVFGGSTGSFQGATETVRYTGAADPTTMKGKVTVGDMGEGTFTGKKQ